MTLLHGPYLLQRMQCRRLAAVAFIVVLLAGVPVSRTEEPPVYALTNGRVVSVSAAVLDKGTVVVRNGIIEAVGSAISPPADARIIDASGLTIYPGFIDGLSDVGLEEERTQTPPAPRAAGFPGFPGQPQPQPPVVAPDERTISTPYLQVADILRPSNTRIETARSAGITTALVAPRTGVFQGQSALVNLSGTSIGKMIVKAPVAMHVALQTSGGFGGSYPGSLMGVFAFVKQTFLDAQHHDSAWSIYNAHPGALRPEYNRALQALQPVLKREIPLVLPGNTPAEISRAVNMADTFNLNLVLSGGNEAAKIAPILKDKKIPVLLSVKFPERERDADPEEVEELETLRRRVEAPATAASLAQAGVRFAFQSGDMANPSDFVRNVAKAVEAGLDRETALRALTLTPAEIFGVADRLGSIEKGKTANLVVTTGDIFDARTRVKYVFVDGRRFEVPEPASQRPTQTPTTRGRNNFSGVWTLKVDSPQGTRDVTANLHHEGARLSGTVASSRGTAEITEGTVSGNDVTFKISLGPAGERSQMIMFAGTIEGNDIVGSADFGAQGKRSFTGSRNPNQLLVQPQRD